VDKILPVKYIYIKNHSGEINYYCSRPLPSLYSKRGSSREKKKREMKLLDNGVSRIVL
jgi:hypothetical protein